MLSVWPGFKPWDLCAIRGQFYLLIHRINPQYKVKLSYPYIFLYEFAPTK